MSTTAILYISDNSLKIAQRLKGLYPDAKILRFESAIMPELWNGCRNLIFIMAAGIVVRTIAPLIKDKKTDPAVVVLDENGNFAISLLSGHIGGANTLAKEIAGFLNSKRGLVGETKSPTHTEAVITTASDVNNMPAIDLWARQNNLIIDDWKLIPRIATRLLNRGSLIVYIQQRAEGRGQRADIKLPDEFLRVDDLGSADVLITNKTEIIPHLINRGEGGLKKPLYLRPKNLVVGIGCNSGTSADEIEGAIKNSLKQNNLSFLSIHCIATIDKKRNEPGLKAFSKKYSFGIKLFSSEELNTVSGVSRSEAAIKATGANAVAEPAALLGSGADTLLIAKQKIGNVTVAVAEVKEPGSLGVKELKTPGLQNSKTPKLCIVGTGPGSLQHLTPMAKKAIEDADVIIGYKTYLDLIKPLLPGKEVLSSGMMQEVDRCKKAIELASSGKAVALVSGGDPGIYGMAGLVFEMLRSQSTEHNPPTHPSPSRGEGKGGGENLDSGFWVLGSEIHIEVIPGITALNASAARLGAPLMHDFASISLSDLLTPWKVIEKRLDAAAMADFVIVLYNPKSRGRVEHINRARDIILRYRPPETPVGIVRAATRDDEGITITTLDKMLEHNIDMQSTVIIGNSKTFLFDRWMVTPRGYEKKLKA